MQIRTWATPDHQVLLLKLAKTGPVLLSGDATIPKNAKFESIVSEYGVQIASRPKESLTCG